MPGPYTTETRRARRLHGGNSRLDGVSIGVWIGLDVFCWLRSAQPPVPNAAIHNNGATI